MFQSLRWVENRGADAPCFDERRSSWSIAFGVALLSSLLILGAASLVASTPARAEGDVVDGMASDPLSLGGGRSMPASNPRVSGILAAHPKQFVVICVAGCSGNGKPQAVQVLAKPVVTRSGEVVPSSADMSKSAYGPPVPNHLKAKDNNEVVCLAGCTKRPGQVVQRVADLPPVERRAQKKPSKQVETPAKPAPDNKNYDDSIWDDLIP